MAELSDADQVWQRMQEVYAGFLAGDPAAVDALLAPEVTIWDSSEPELARGLAALRELRTRRPDPDSGPSVADIQASDPVVDVWGDTALLRHRLRVVFSDDHGDQQVRNTSVWRRTNGRWLAVHNHEDVIAG